MPLGGASPDPVDIAVGARIRARRCALGLGQETLGALVGLSGQTVRKIEAGSTALSPGRLVSLARALAVDVAYFFAPDDWNHGAADHPPPVAELVAE
ncbi:MAG: helix-turn-helix domain-containing protein [Stellaceae bacterium]